MGIILYICDMEKICVICNTPFSRKIYPSGSKERLGKFQQRECCSKKCGLELGQKRSKENRVGKKAHNNKQVERVCITCGKVELVSPAYSDRPYCSRDCMSKHYSTLMTGENHRNWQGGITETKSRDNLYEGYKDWRKTIYKRDGYRCKICGNNKSGSLRAHHIKPRHKYPELVVDIDNGVCVCDKCHKEIHYEGKHQDYLQG